MKLKFKSYNTGILKVNKNNRKKLFLVSIKGLHATPTFNGYIFLQFDDGNKQIHLPGGVKMHRKIDSKDLKTNLRKIEGTLTMLNRNYDLSSCKAYVTPYRHPTDTPPHSYPRQTS